MAGYQAALVHTWGDCMRAIVSALTAFAMLAAQSAFAARHCDSVADQSAFEVQALRTELSVLAMGCHNEDDRYNAFMRRYQPDLMANERSVDAWFKHRYGKSAQTEHDRFVTDLANALSRQSSELGGDFCPRNGMMFSEVLALQTPAQLPEFAAGKDLIPASVEVCTPIPAKTAPVHRVAAVTSKKKKH